MNSNWISVSASFTYKGLGCYFDKNSPRAIPSLEKKCDLLDGRYSNRNDAIQKCAECANWNGFEIFAVSRNGECLSSADALGNYFIHGSSTNCNEKGTGSVSPRSMEVYKVVQGKWYILNGGTTLGLLKIFISLLTCNLMQLDYSTRAKVD